MKKMLIFGLALLLLSAAIFADDAKVMPMMVGRLYAAPFFSFAGGAFDKDGNFQKYKDGPIKIFNFGLVLEYGVIDWVTAALQWAPGWTPWSYLKPAAPETMGATNDVNANGFADIFAGFKIQIAGEKAPIKTTMLRFSAAPGVVIPVSGPDFNHEFDIINNGDPATIKKMDNHVFAVGGRVYFDYIFNKNFFINLYNETMFYPVKQDLNRDGPALAVAKKAIPAGIYKATYKKYESQPMAEAYATGAKNHATNGLKDASGDVNYKFRMTFELEPVFTTPIAKGLSFTAGLPLNYRYIPAFEYSVNNVETHADLAASDVNLESLLRDNIEEKPKHILYLNPNVSFFLTSTPLPLEFKFIYGIPIYGQNSTAQHNMIFQMRAYFAIPRKSQ